MNAKRTILVVDDDRPVREHVARSLEIRGHRVLTCEDGLAALSLLVDTEVDLILVDFVMPRLNGYHFLRALEAKRLSPDAPVILMSGLVEKIRERIERITRVQGFLEKPFTTERLVRVVEDALGGEVELEVAVDAPSARDETWMVVASVREAIQAAVQQHLGEHLAALAAAQAEDELRARVALLLDKVFEDEALSSQLLEMIARERPPGIPR